MKTRPIFIAAFAAALLALFLSWSARGEGAPPPETFPVCAHPMQPAFVLLDETTGLTIEAETFVYQPDSRTLRYKPRECVFADSFEG